jgi:hypothetical protein
MCGRPDEQIADAPRRMSGGTTVLAQPPSLDRHLFGGRWLPTLCPHM